MALEYQNRRGQTYRVFQGTTKTGKPTYYCRARPTPRKSKSKNPSDRAPPGVAIDRLPDDFELYESPINGTVTVRRKRVSRLVEAERQALFGWVESLSTARTFRVEIEESSLVLYCSEVDDRGGLRPLVEDYYDAFGDTLLRRGKTRTEALARIYEILASSAPMSPKLRFTLLNQEERTFFLEEWYESPYENDGDWISTLKCGSLEELARASLPNLGKEDSYGL